MENILKDYDCKTNDNKDFQIENYFSSLATIIEKEKDLKTIGLINREINKLEHLCSCREFYLESRNSIRNLIRTCKTKSDENSAQ